MSADPDPDEAAVQGRFLAERSESLRAALMRYFRRRLPAGSGEAEDLVQEVFLRIVKRGDSAGLEHFGGYVFETAASVIKDRQRRRHVRAADQHVSFESDLHASATPDPERAFLDQEALRWTTRTIMALPERTRVIFVLRRLEGLPLKEIAKRLGLSLSTVEKHIQRAGQALFAERNER
jgi:RNA polymerase sigma factor (sigma-70 family)